MAAPGTTVCIIPRERFSAAVPALEALLDDPDLPERLIYFDGGSPAKVRDELERLARQHDITLIRSDAYVVPNDARNHVFPRVDTEFTAFIDNDVFVTRGWVPRLEATARATGAAVVAPMYGVAVDDLAAATVHLAGAENHFSGEPGHRHVHMDFFHENRDPTEVRAELQAGPTEQAEFHLFFARTDALAQVVPLNPRLKSIQEHLDACLRIMDGGGKVWFEPQVFATYVVTAHKTLADRRFHLLRWSRRWNEESLKTFCELWGVDPDDSTITRLRWSTAYKRKEAYRPYRSPVGWWKAKRGQHSMPLPDHTIGPAVAWYEDRRRVRAPEPRVIHLASWDDAGASAATTS
jgi:Glycosyl transferase family 2